MAPMSLAIIQSPSKKINDSTNDWQSQILPMKGLFEVSYGVLSTDQKNTFYCGFFLNTTSHS